MHLFQKVFSEYMFLKLCFLDLNLAFDYTDIKMIEIFKRSAFYRMFKMSDINEDDSHDPLIEKTIVDLAVFTLSLHMY